MPGDVRCINEYFCPASRQDKYPWWLACNILGYSLEGRVELLPWICRVVTIHFVNADCYNHSSFISPNSRLREMASISSLKLIDSWEVYTWYHSPSVLETAVTLSKRPMPRPRKRQIRSLQVHPGSTRGVERAYPWTTSVMSLWKPIIEPVVGVESYRKCKINLKKICLITKLIYRS